MVGQNASAPYPTRDQARFLDLGGRRRVLFHVWVTPDP
jgi:hypothetical protein